MESSHAVVVKTEGIWNPPAAATMETHWMTLDQLLFLYFILPFRVVVKIKWRREKLWMPPLSPLEDGHDKNKIDVGGGM